MLRIALNVLAENAFALCCWGSDHRSDNRLFGERGDILSPTGHRHSDVLGLPFHVDGVVRMRLATGEQTGSAQVLIGRQSFSCSEPAALLTGIVLALLPDFPIATKHANIQP